MQGLSFRLRLQFFGFFDHPYDAVIASLAGGMDDADAALTLFHHRAGIDCRSGLFQNRQRLAGKGGLIDHHLPGDHDSVQRDGGGGADDDGVSFFYGVHMGKHLLAVFIQHPYLIDIEFHRPGQIINGFPVRIVFEDFTEAKQEHDRGRCRMITCQKRHRDRSRIKHRYIEFPVQQALKSLHDKRDRLHSGDKGFENIRHKEPAKHSVCNMGKQILLKITTQPSSVGNLIFFCFLIIPIFGKGI